MQIDHTIPTFSMLWWTWIAPIALLLYVLLYWGKMTSAENKIRLSKGLALSYVPFLVLGPWVLYQQGYFDLKYSLPLHLCGFGSYLMVFAFYFRYPLLYEICLFYGIAGASQALLTPQFTQGTHPFTVLDYWVGHSLFFFSGIFITAVFKMKPRKNAWWKTAVLLHLIALPIGLVNYFLDANYLFLCTKPKVDNPLLLGDWPYYLIGFELLIFPIFFLIQFITLKISSK